MVIYRNELFHNYHIKKLSFFTNNLSTSIIFFNIYRKKILDPKKIIIVLRNDTVFKVTTADTLCNVQFVFLNGNMREKN